MKGGKVIPILNAGQYFNKKSKARLRLLLKILE